MRNILLVEPAYRSKFPPLGLLKIGTYHKRKGDVVSFVRGNDPSARAVRWHRIYVASLFTWELPRTVHCVKYYAGSVAHPEDIVVGGVGATLLPGYLRDHVSCRIIEGQLNKPGVLEPRSANIALLPPDYSLLDNCDYAYSPTDAYFTRITQGCIRSCSFCAVPILEREFGFLQGLQSQIATISNAYGERKDLVVLDNNILGIQNIESVLSDIARLGFEKGARLNGKQRSVDFNQGLDARIIAENPRLATEMAKTCLNPVRLAFDFVGLERCYRKAVRALAESGFTQFTNYMLFNFSDRPEDLFKRIQINGELNQQLGVRITGFPMRFIPMNDVSRAHVSDGWHWRYLRGVQCVLLVAHGLVSPNPDFVTRAFGATIDEFLEILCMPDRYIIYRNHFESNGAPEWRKKFRRLKGDQRVEFLNVLAALNKDRKRKQTISSLRRFRSLLEHYYPGGATPSNSPPEQKLQEQGVSVGYD